MVGIVAAALTKWMAASRSTLKVFSQSAKRSVSCTVDRSSNPVSATLASRTYTHVSTLNLGDRIGCMH